MRIRVKLFILIFLPLLLLSVYQMYTINQTFTKIEKVRSQIFVQSTEQVKHAGLIRFYVILMNNKLYEMNNAYVNQDQNALLTAIQIYRGAQQERFYGLQKLKELGEKGADDVIQQENYLEAIMKMEELMKEIDRVNENIIAQMGLVPRIPGQPDRVVDTIIHDSAPLNLEVTGMLTEFVEQRISIMLRTVQQVDEVESISLKSLYLTTALSFIVGILTILFIDHLIVYPIERMARILDSREPQRIVTMFSHGERKDEIGFLARVLKENILLLQNGKKEYTRARNKRRRKKTILPHANG